MLKQIKRSEVLDTLDQNKEVYMLVPVLPDTTVSELLEIETFFADIEDEEETEEDEQPDEDDEEIAEDPEEEDETEDEPAENEDDPKEPSTRQKVRHQSIINMYMNGRSIRYIAQEFEINPATVKYHLHKDGLV